MMRYYGEYGEDVIHLDDMIKRFFGKFICKLRKKHDYIGIGGIMVCRICLRQLKEKMTIIDRQGNCMGCFLLFIAVMIIIYWIVL